MTWKRFLLCALAGMLIFSACNKNDGPSNEPKSTWTIDGVTYTSSTPATYVSDDLAATDNTLNGDIGIIFHSRPTMDGSYAVSDFGDTSVANPGSGSSTCNIQIRTPTVSDYLSTGNEMVNVTINGGKLTATFSNVQMKSGSQTGKVSGTIIEK